MCSSSLNIMKEFSVALVSIFVLVFCGGAGGGELLLVPNVESNK